MKKAEEHIRQYTARKTTKMTIFVQRINKIMKYFNQNILTTFKKSEEHKRQNTVRKPTKIEIFDRSIPLIIDVLYLRTEKQ